MKFFKYPPNYYVELSISNTITNKFDNVIVFMCHKLVHRVKTQKVF